MKENSLRPWVLIPEMSYRIEQNDNDIFFILYDIWSLHFFTIKDRSAIYLVKNARKISTFLNYRTSETNWKDWIFLCGGGVDYDIEHCHFFSYFLPNLQLNIGKKNNRSAIYLVKK
jgi:hypothetical protein